MINHLWVWPRSHKRFSTLLRLYYSTGWTGYMEGAPVYKTKDQEDEYVNLTIPIPVAKWGDPLALAEYLAEIAEDINRKNQYRKNV